MSAERQPASVRVVEAIARRLGGRGVDRRSVLLGTAVAGSAIATDPKGYVLRPQTAYASICGPGTGPGAGWTVFCASINNGKNACPEGSFAAGWWKAADSSWCGGRYRYIVDCNARCTKCTTGCSDGICDSTCWNCSCSHGVSGSCDDRRNCCSAFRYGQCNTHVACSGGVRCRLVSCTPPYEWESCTSLSLVDNRTSEHSSDKLPQWGAISAKYFAMGEQKSYLGYSIGPVRPGGVGTGRFVRYSGGRIYQATSKAAAVPVREAVVKAMSTVGSIPTLGYPVATEFIGSTGSTQRFQKGAITAPKGKPLVAVHGTAYEVWERLGRAGGTLGYPTGGRQAVANGYQQIFERGAVCQNWSGGETRVVTGVHFTAWTTFGRGTGTALGMPTTDVSTLARGTRQRFQRGETWSLGTGEAWAVYGPVLDAWKAARSHVGSYGYPTGHVQQRSDGQWEGTFEGGTIVA